MASPITPSIPEQDIPEQAIPVRAIPVRASEDNCHTFVDGRWVAGDAPLMYAMTHAVWLGSVVFDGARAFEGTAPDLDMHCARTITSAEAMGLGPTLTADEIEGIARDGIKRFAPGAHLYVRPMFFAEDGFLAPDPAATKFALVIWEEPLPDSTGFSAVVSPFRRPPPDAAISDAKASCHYPNLGRAMTWAKQRGFNNAVVLDPAGKVAEFASSNLFMVRDGVAVTPAANGTFLNGVTRRRVLSLLQADGIAVEERGIDPAELDQADEIFSTGNYGKVMPTTRMNDRSLQPGPIYRRARELYWDYAHSRKR